MNMKKTALAAVLTCTVLASAAMAAPVAAKTATAGETPAATAVPLDPGPDADAAADYTVTPWAGVMPTLFSGLAAEVGEGRFTIEDQSQTGSLGKVVVNVGEDTLILDAVSGEVKGFGDIKEGQEVYAYVGPAMIRSLPPIANGVLLLVNIPADFGVPTYSEILNVTHREDGGVDLYVTGDMVLHLYDAAEITAFKTKNVVGMGDLKPGMRILSWYSMVMESFPAQANPEKVLVFPSAYAGYVETAGDKVLVNGQTDGITGLVEDGHLLVPVRALAESLGFEVRWDPEGNQVVVEQSGNEFYHFVIGSETAVKEGDMALRLTVPSKAVDGVTYLALDDLLALHQLKLVERPFI